MQPMPLQETFVICAMLFIMSWPAAAQAMTGGEFAALPAAGSRLAEAERCLRAFESQGYRELPDACSLAARMERIIEERAWQGRWVDIISLTAALELGMRR